MSLTTDPDADTLILVIAATTLLIALFCAVMAIRKWQREAARFVPNERLNQHRVTPRIPLPSQDEPR